MKLERKQDIERVIAPVEQENWKPKPRKQSRKKKESEQLPSVLATKRTEKLIARICTNKKTIRNQQGN